MVAADHDSLPADPEHFAVRIATHIANEIAVGCDDAEITSTSKKKLCNRKRNPTSRSERYRIWSESEDLTLLNAVKTCEHRNLQV